MDTIPLANLGGKYVVVTFHLISLILIDTLTIKAYHILFVDANMGLAQRPKAVAGLKPV